MKVAIRLALASLFLMHWSGTAVAGQASGTINVVNVNQLWNGLMVQLNVPATFGYESACPFGNWAFISIDDPFFKPILATLLAAKASGEIVTVYTSGCVSTAGTTVPRITVIDYGLR